MFWAEMPSDFRANLATLLDRLPLEFMELKHHRVMDDEKRQFVVFLQCLVSQSFRECERIAFF